MTIIGTIKGNAVIRIPRETKVINIRMRLSKEVQEEIIDRWRRGAMAIPARYLNALERGVFIPRDVLMADLRDLKHAVGWVMAEPAVCPEDKTIVRRRRCHFTAAVIVIDLLLTILETAHLQPIIDIKLKIVLLKLQQTVDGLAELTRKRYAHTQ